MAKQYQVTPMVRFANRMMKLLLRLGLAPKGTYLLTVPGRKTGPESPLEAFVAEASRHPVFQIQKA